MRRIFTILLLASAVVSCKQEYGTTESKNNSTLKKVRVTPINGLSATPTIHASGKLASKDEVVLSFKTGGVLNSLRFEEGQKIKKQTTLASLNLSEINAQVQSAQNAYDKSVRDYERATNLYRDTVGTLQQKQNTKTALDIAKSQLEIVNFNRQYSVINSPFQGTILKKYVEKGQLVSPGQPIYLIGSSGQKGAQIVKTGLSDKDVVQLSMGDSAMLVFDAFAKAEYKGTITKIAESGNTSTGLFDVEITLTDYHSELKNGFISTVTIQPQTGGEILKIPMNALVEGSSNNARIYYTLDKATVKEVEVNVIDLNDDYFTIRVGTLPAIAQIINEGAPFLKVNDSIQIVE